MFWLRFIHCTMVSPFVLPYLPFPLTSEWKGVRNRWRGVDILYGFYLFHHANGQMHVCLIASSVKIVTKRIAVMYRFKSARMVSYWDLYACSWGVMCQYSWCYQASMMIDWKINEICDILCLNKCDRVGLRKSTMWAQITPSYNFDNIFYSKCAITFL